MDVYDVGRLADREEDGDPSARDYPPPILAPLASAGQSQPRRASQFDTSLPLENLAGLAGSDEDERDMSALPAALSSTSISPRVPEAPRSSVIPTIPRPTRLLPLSPALAAARDGVVEIEVGAAGGVTDHGDLTGLADDDHLQYALLAGRAGGQNLIGGTAAGDDLTLRSTSNATKGTINFGASGNYVFDDANNRLGLGVAAPEAQFHAFAAGGDHGLFETSLSGGETNNLVLRNDQSAPATGMRIKFEAQNASAALIGYANLTAMVKDSTAGSEDGAFSIRVRSGGAINNHAYAIDGLADDHIWRRPSTGADLMRLISTGLGIGIFAPDTTLHVHKGSAGAVAAPSEAVAVVESSASAAALSFLTPNVSSAAIIFGDVGSNIAGQFIYNHAFTYMHWIVEGGSKMFLDQNGNLTLDSSPSAGASAARTLNLLNATAPTGSIANGVILYAEDVAASSELKVRDEAGNVTVLSPHHFSLFQPDASCEFPWSYYSKNDFLGREINVDMFGAIREIERLSGKQFIHLADIPRADWDKAQEALRRERDARIEALAKHPQHEPPPQAYRKKPMPGWMRVRVGAGASSESAPEGRAEEPRRARSKKGDRP